MADLTGRILQGRYRIEELVGRGGMAEVYRAWDTWRNYYVAIKMMREDLAEDLEFVRAELTRVELARAGDDGLDLMGSRVTLRDSVVAGCRNNGISSGEETRLGVRSSLVAGLLVQTTPPAWSSTRTYP